MNKAVSLIIACCLLSPLANATAQFVSDDISAYLHSGASPRYRIIGALPAGEPIEVLQRQGDYSQVKTPQGTTGWIKSADVQPTPSFRQHYLRQTEEITALTQQLTTLQRELTSTQQQLTDLAAQLAEQEKTGQSWQDKYTALAKENDHSAEQLKMEWLWRGGALVLIGLVLGAILLSLPRRQRQDRW